MREKELQIEYTNPEGGETNPVTCVLVLVSWPQQWTQPGTAASTIHPTSPISLLHGVGAGRKEKGKWTVSSAQGEGV